MKDLLKNWKMLLLIVLVIGSVVAIGVNFDPKGVVITYKAKNSTAPVYVNDVLYKINDQPADLDMLTKNHSGIVKFSTSRGDKIVQINGSLGLNGKKVAATKITFGLDIEGGVRAVIKPNLDNESSNQTIEQIISTLQTRINVYGLREANFRTIYDGKQGYIEIIMAGGNQEELKDLLEHQGKFEAKIPLLIKLADGRSQIVFDKAYDVVLSGNGVDIGGVDIEQGKSAKVAGVEIYLNSFTNDTVNITTTVFSGNDIVLVYSDPQRSGVQKESNGFEWYFQVKLSDAGAQRFAWITQNLEKKFDVSSGESYLSSKLSLYLDNDLVDELNIVDDLKGKVVQEPAVTGYGRDPGEAVKSQRKLQSILRSGSLPTSVEIVQLEVISPTLGAGFLTSILIAIVAAVLAVSVIIAVRYRRAKIVIPMIATSMSEIIIIFGLSVVIGWTIDIASMAAIIAIIGTGIDAQIILIDQAIRGEERTMTMKEKIARAFFIILGAGGTVIGAMLPLTVLGLGVLRGFAITTILGVLIGIFITRPAFGEVVKKVVG